jgi:hypothetical protein
MKFQEDIPCLAYVLNLVVQDILKAIIKDAYNNLDNNNIYNIKNKEEEEEEEEVFNSKLFKSLFIYINIIY